VKSYYNKINWDWIGWNFYFAFLHVERRCKGETALSRKAKEKMKRV